MKMPLSKTGNAAHTLSASFFTHRSHPVLFAGITIMFSLLTFCAVAQSSASASANASIVNPVGIAEWQQEEAKLPARVTAVTPRGGTKSAQEPKTTAALAEFQFVGANDNIFSFSLSAPAVWLSSANGNNGFLVDELQIAASNSPSSEQFVINGNPQIFKNLPTGSYANVTPVEIAVHLN